MDSTPPRVIFNFTSKCNMGCAFCYIPFDGHPIEQTAAIDVLDEVLRRGPLSITFGGGDPLMYPFLEQLISTVRKQTPSVFLQLDTNGIACTPDRLLSITRAVDLVGLPLDGVSNSVVRAMRGSTDHGTRILALLKVLSAAGLAAKVNTVASRRNIRSLEDVGNALTDMRVARWSLYEFWPLGRRARENSAAFEVSAADFWAAVHHLRARFPHLNIEPSCARQRSRAYFFVTPTGRAYVEDELSESGYRDLGNVRFDSDVWQRWGEYVDASKNRERFEVRRHPPPHDLGPRL
jgi:MoaA/NifB/PqqE/SkfB family radical SAM enzyme